MVSRSFDNPFREPGVFGGVEFVVVDEFGERGDFVGVRAALLAKCFKVKAQRFIDHVINDATRRVVAAGGFAGGLGRAFIGHVHFSEQVFKDEAEQFGIERDFLFERSVLGDGEFVALEDAVQAGNFDGLFFRLQFHPLGVKQFVRNGNFFVVNRVGSIVLQQAIKQAAIEIRDFIEQRIIEIVRQIIFAAIGELLELRVFDGLVIGGSGGGESALIHRRIQAVEENILQDAAIVAVAFGKLRGGLRRTRVDDGVAGDIGDFQQRWRDEAALLEKPAKDGSDTAAGW